VNGHQQLSSAAELFVILWDSLSDVLGTAATAALLRRAIKGTASRDAWTHDVIIVRNGLDYKYRLPEAWSQPGNEDALGGLRAMALELRTLLVQMTGPVVVRRLSRLTGFRDLGIQFSEEARDD
jgi:hypothetical protein